jgi:hypothetical protein
MQAHEIEKWLVKVLEHGATELVDAEIAKHIVRVFQLTQARYPSVAVLNMDGAAYEIAISTERQLRHRLATSEAGRSAAEKAA